MNRTKSPRVLAVLPRVIPSTIIGVIKPLVALHRQKQIIADLTLEYLVAYRQVAQADVIIFCRNADPMRAQALEWAKQLGKPIIYELDDNLLELPAEVEVGDSHHNAERVRQLRDYLSTANLVRVYSEHLQKKITALNTNIVRVDGPVDWSLIPSKSPRGGTNKIHIVYATSRIHDELADLFLDDAAHLLDEFPNRVELTLWGCETKQLARHPAVHRRNFIPDYDRFFRAFARAGFDIGLAPLLADDFYLCKSNNKFREYAACGIAGVYSNVPVYSADVREGVTGLLVENEPGAWYKALARLVCDEDLRTRIQINARQFARAHYAYEQFNTTWLAQIRATIAAPRRNLPPEPALFGIADRSRTSRQLIARILRLGWRFGDSVRRRGIRQSLDIARWTLNDLSILLWKWLGRG